MEPLNHITEPPNKLPVLRRRKTTEDQLAHNQYVEVSPYPSRYDASDDTGTSGLVAYWRVLRRHLRVWIIFAIAGAVLGYLITLPETRIYQARTSLEVLGLNENFMNMKQASPTTDNDGDYEISEVQTQIKILKSDSLLNRVRSKLKRAQTGQWKDPSRISAWLRILNLPRPSPAEAYANALDDAAYSIKSRAEGQTRIIDVTIDSADPKLATDFANTLANEFIEQNLESRWKTTEKTSNWLSQHLDDMRVKLERSEDALQTYARQSGLLFTEMLSTGDKEEKTSVSADKLRQIQQELSKTQADLIAKQSRYEIAHSSPPDSLPDTLADEALQDSQAKISDLRQQIADLSTTYTPEYGKLVRLRAQLAALQADFDHHRAAIMKRIDNDYEEAVRKEKLLGMAYDTQAKLVSGEGEKSIQYHILERDVESNRQLYENMLQQLKESSIASAMRASNIRVVDPAEVPTRPDRPRPVRSTALGLFGGILIGAAFIVMRERADRTIQQPGDSTFYLSVPELGIIPSYGLDTSRRKPSRPRSAIGISANSEAAGPRKTQDRLELITWQHKPSMVAESFRSTLMSILFASQNGEQAKVFVITSAGPGEGKSTVASNLAIAIAEIGNKVLLIDADLRRPRQHDIFNMENKRGLSTVLRERATLNGDQSLNGLIREAEIPGLFVLTSGPGTSATTNLLYGSHLPEFLNYVRAGFDTVLIDTPPVLQISDARVLGRMADDVIMVIRAGHTTRDSAVAARQRLSEDGTTVLGTILNDWDPKRSPNGYYGYYNNYYSYYKRYSTNLTGNT